MNGVGSRIAPISAFPRPADSENQRLELKRVAVQRGWQVTEDTRTPASVGPRGR